MLKSAPTSTRDVQGKSPGSRDMKFEISQKSILAANNLKNNVFRYIQ